MPEIRSAEVAPIGSSKEREHSLKRLSGEMFDVVVIGGGIAGACTAWDAAMRGLRVALIEQADFGGGTSAQSLKVLHGGIRYLQHLDIARLRESCAERGAFLRIAPHLTRPIPFALPTYGWGMRGKTPLRAAFALLNMFTAGRNRGVENRGQHIPLPFILSKGEFLAKFPAFNAPGLSGAGVFFDGQMLNPPRIVFCIVRSAQAASAVALNYCAAQGLLVRDGRIEGVTARDQCTGEVFDIRAKLVANMTGPYAPAFLRGAQAQVRLEVPLSRDMAIVINRKLLPDMGIGIQTRYKDPDAWLSRGNRHLFMAPWRDYTLIGVNSRVYQGNPFDLTVTEEEIEGFVQEVCEACPALGITRSDIAVVNAGLLPFGENDPDSKDLSFGKRSVLVDHGAAGGPDGLISGMSVRWTMGRLLAERTVDLIMGKLHMEGRECRSNTTAVHGGDFRDRDELLGGIARRTGFGFPAGAVTHLADTFGTLWSEVMKLQDGTTLLPDGMTLAAEARYAARSEMVVTLADIVLRRLDLGTGSIANSATLDACARIAGEELGWSAQRQRAEVDRVRRSYPFASPASQQITRA
ncbi:MAG: glycerol-3-phosphate dehydrogenase/oxidase [Pseudomonadota bacterium]|nr:glycerol-3-phosphate dehydrogenase/oxidase [Pseudomonadota bacterium]